MVRFYRADRFKQIFVEGAGVCCLGAGKTFSVCTENRSSAKTAVLKQFLLS